MKKMMFFAALATFAMNMALPGQVITVTSPTAADDWCIGTTYSITWTKAGTMPNTVTVRLRRAGSDNSEPGAAVIANETDNNGTNGTFRWPVPASIAAGEYFIRVKTVGSPAGIPEVSGDSPDFSIRTCASSGASIIVTQPNGSSSWRPGSNHTITWTKSGTMGHMVAITLRREGAPEADPPAARIVDGCANNESRMWFIADSLAEGRYFVRIKTPEGVTGNSAVFSISATGAGSEPATPDSPIRADLELAGVGVEYYNGNIVAWVRNNGPDALANHDVKFLLNFPERGGGGQYITKRMTVPSGQERSVDLQPLAAADIPNAGLRTSVSIDTSRSNISDANRLNQHRDVRLGGLDIGLTIPRERFKLSRLYGMGGKDYKTECWVHVRHNLPRNVDSVRVFWVIDTQGGAVSVGSGSFTFDPLRPSPYSNEKGVIRIFGKYGRPNAITPMLIPGASYRFWARISDPDNVLHDINPDNNQASISFTVPD